MNCLNIDVVVFEVFEVDCFKGIVFDCFDYCDFGEVILFDLCSSNCLIGIFVVKEVVGLV